MAGRDIPWSNVAFGGASWTALAPDAPTALYPKATAGMDILVMCGGSQDITDGDSGQTLYDEEVAYAAGARSAGFDRVLVVTLVGNVSNSADQNAARLAHNDLLRTDPAGAFDAVVDLDATALADWTNATYYEDGIHWTTAGAQLAAATIAPDLDDLLD
jgi:hypothetical protein